MPAVWVQAWKCSVSAFKQCSASHIDDIIGVDVPSKIHNSFTLLQETLIYLGFVLSHKKIVPPTTNLNCLGIMVDSTTFTASTQSDKLQEIFDMCSQWRNREECNSVTFNRFLAVCFIFQNVLKILVFFLNRMLEFLRGIPEGNKVQIPLEFHQDLNWLLQFLKKFNGVTFF